MIIAWKMCRIFLQSGLPLTLQRRLLLRARLMPTVLHPLDSRISGEHGHNQTFRRPLQAPRHGPHARRGPLRIGDLESDQRFATVVRARTNAQGPIGLPAARESPCNL